MKQLNNKTDINWASNTFIPVVVQSVDNGEVLMLAYANEEALTLTINTGFAHYYSRSRQKIWKKGETSGNTQLVMNIKLDCDADSLLYIVKQYGVACHTGEKSCFYSNIPVKA
jgi:phosphoribosyl-AMP cyclohydrolase